MKKRICVDCGDVLNGQKGWHTSTKQQVKGNKIPSWIQSRAVNGKYNRTDHPSLFWCTGPERTPGAAPRKTSKAVHYRFYASSYSESLCGLTGGRVAGKHKDPNAQIPWTRLNVKLEQTTCEECLALVATVVNKKLKERLDEVGKTMEQVLEQARGRLTMNGIRKVVGTAG